MKRIFLCIAFLLSLSGKTQAQGAAYTAGPFSASGYLYVCPVPSGGTPCPSPSSLFSNVALTSAIANPLFISQGNTASFYISPGQYTIEFPATGYNFVASIGSSSGGGGANSVGPVINPLTTPGLTGCPAAANADWATCFASASTAYNNASLIGTPTVRASTTAVCQPCTSFPITITSQPGDTALVWIGGPGLADTVSVSDNASTPNLYRVISPLAAGSTTTWGLYGTVPRGVLNGATTITITDGTSRNLYAIVALISNYGAEKDLIPFTSASTSAPSILNASTLDANNLWLVGFNWFLTGQTVTAVANSGSVVQNAPSNSTTLGLGLVSNTVASQFAASTDSLTLSQASTAQGIGVEVRSHSEVMPTLYLPAVSPEYIYTGGLSLLYPGTLKGEPGTRLCYIGSTHAGDFGPTGMTANAFFRTYWVDGVQFSCGSKMTAGLYFNTYANFVGVRNSTFLDFGNSTAYMIQGVSNNQDMEIGPQNKFITDDGLPRNIFENETANVANASYARIHDNLIVCWNLQALVPTQCSTAQAGIGFNLNGAQSRFYGTNNFAFYNPDILFRCNPGPCFGNEASGLQLEPPTSGTTPGSPIQFQGAGASGQIGLLIHDNVANMGSFSTVSLLGPNDGTSTLIGARVNFNTVVNVGAGTPTVALNNIAGQISNQSSNNMCGTSAVSVSACLVPHTTGSNIVAWAFNNDDLHQSFGYAITGTTFTTNNGCGETTNLVGGATGGTIHTSGSTSCTTIVTMGNKLTAPNGWACDVTDTTTVGDVHNPSMNPTSTTTATIVTGTIVSGDTLQFKCTAY